MFKRCTHVGASLVVLSVCASPLLAGPREVKTLESAAETIHFLSDIPLRGIPHGLLRDARGVAIIPGVVKAGLGFDARFGRGVVLVRQADGCWGNPIFITLSGGGVGVQLGIESTDVVLVFRTATSVDRFLKGKGKLTLGGDVGIAAGPVGREAEAATDARLRAEIFSYSRSRGFFAGASLEGAALLIDHKANDAFYSPQPAEVAARENAAVEHLKQQLSRISAPPVMPPVVVTPPPPYFPAPIPPPPPPPWH
jgi:lipid-binding SYLF domain-containing protein